MTRPAALVASIFPALLLPDPVLTKEVDQQQQRDDDDCHRTAEDVDSERVVLFAQVLENAQHAAPPSFGATSDDRC